MSATTEPVDLLARSCQCVCWESCRPKQINSGRDLLHLCSWTRACRARGRLGEAVRAMGHERPSFCVHFCILTSILGLIVPVFVNDVFCAFVCQLSRRSAQQASMNSHAKPLVLDEASVVLRTLAPRVYTLLAQGVQEPLARVTMRSAPASQRDTSSLTSQFLVVGRIMR